jgi:AcrR family transcriptional regulator
MATRAPASLAGPTDDDLEPVGCGPQPGLRERKRLRTERELKEATLRLALERGWDHVTIDDIAAEAEVSKTTFYRYFDSKEDALLGNPAEKTAGIVEALAERPATEPTLTAVRTAIIGVINSYEHDRETSLAIGRVIRSTPALIARNLEHQAVWEAMLADFVRGRLEADQEPDAELRSRVVAAIVVATLRSTIDYWRDTDGADHLPDLMDASLAMLAEKRAALVVRR